MPTVETRDESATVALGARLGARLFPGAAIALVGPLGAGKTALARGIARGLGVAGRVRSPTFVLAARYESGRLPLVHADLYRLDDAREIATLDLHGQQAEGAVILVEWADRFPEALPPDHLRIALDIGDGDARTLAFTAGPRHQPLLAALDG
jgi:tRNA threonylcarbamoyladenosine biosynthesis protein TsaE